MSPSICRKRLPTEWQAGTGGPASWQMGGGCDAPWQEGAGGRASWQGGAGGRASWQVVVCHVDKLQGPRIKRSSHGEEPARASHLYDYFEDPSDKLWRGNYFFQTEGG